MCLRVLCVPRSWTESRLAVGCWYPVLLQWHAAAGAYHVGRRRRARQAATCGRCRAELGEGGRVCAHCRLDERWLAWELRLFSLQSRALAAGAAVSAADALRQVSQHPP
jgi:hypothetical protein